jgi:TnpA family transposase
MKIVANLIKESVNKFDKEIFLVDRGLYRTKEFSYQEIYELALSL